MSIRSLKTFLAWTAMTAAASAAAQTTMTVAYLDDSRQPTVTVLSDESKLIFSGKPAFSFTNCQGGTGEISVADVKRITFEGSWSGVKQTHDNASVLRLRKNPVDDILSIEGFTAGDSAVLSIYSIAGRKVRHIAEWNGEDLDISNLPVGVYILRINNTTIKFVKK